MDLWIRSQDRKVLTKVNDVEMDVYDFKRKVIKCNLGTCLNDSHVLGTYESEERSLEVLDEIQNILKNNQYGYKVNGLGEKVDIIPNQIYVYEMPKE